jgi:hypothetical protein
MPFATSGIKISREVSPFSKNRLMRRCTVTLHAISGYLPRSPRFACAAGDFMIPSLRDPFQSGPHDLSQLLVPNHLGLSDFPRTADGTTSDSRIKRDPHFPVTHGTFLDMPQTTKVLVTRPRVCFGRCHVGLKFRLSSPASVIQKLPLTRGESAHRELINIVPSI